VTWESYLAYAAACLAITIVPGPTVTVIIANALRHGPRAGILNVAGTQIGLALMMAVVAIGLTGVLAVLGAWFDWLRLLGAAYLIWLGVRLILHPPGLDADTPTKPPRGGYVLQGLLVILSNPKALLVFGAFIPQFVDPAQNAAWQVMLLGGTFMVIGTITDSAYALVIGRARGFISSRRIRLIGRISGCFLIGGGAWLALTRTR
jgi:threonine/homoserine/homoserine lactone efflux protein